MWFLRAFLILVVISLVSSWALSWAFTTRLVVGMHSLTWSDGTIICHEGGSPAIAEWTTLPKDLTSDGTSTDCWPSPPPTMRTRFPGWIPPLAVAWLTLIRPRIPTRLAQKRQQSAVIGVHRRPAPWPLILHLGGRDDATQFSPIGPRVWISCFRRRPPFSIARMVVVGHSGLGKRLPSNSNVPGLDPPSCASPRSSKHASPTKVARHVPEVWI